ncbi:MAG: DUF1116 domain-containing protein [Alphaproteobacteria bacterium]
MTDTATRDETREAANARAFSRMTGAEPVLRDIRPAIDALPGMSPDLILTSGPAMPFEEYSGGQREALIGGALYEGLAGDRQQAIERLRAGTIRIGGCHEYGAVGSLAGIYTASMPVFVVENTSRGNIGFCNIYEGTDPERLNYGVYNEKIHRRLKYIADVVSPAIARAVRDTGGIPLKPLMVRALHMGDELHSRNTAAALLFLRELVPAFLRRARNGDNDIDAAVQAMTEDHYFFLRLSMAAAKVAADAAHNVGGSSLVTGMAFNCRGFAIRVSGLGDLWYTGPHADVSARLFDGFSEADITWMGGESPITETIGLGGFAQAAAFPLQRYQGGSAQKMIERNLALYRITEGENPDFRIPALDYRGTPTGIDIFRVIETGIQPVMDIGIAGRNGGQIGAGIVRAPLDCFKAAVDDFRHQISNSVLRESNPEEG